MLPLQPLLLRSRRLPLLVMGVTLVILAATIVLAGLQLRQRIRAQIVGRDAAVLHAVALMLQYEAAQETETAGEADDPVNQSLLLLKTSRLGGVLAARLFDHDGRFIEAFPPDVLEAALDANALRLARRLVPGGRFHPRARLSELFKAGEPEEPVPLLEVNVPLPSAQAPRLLGVAQFILEGQSIAAEYAQLDRNLIWQGLAALGVGGGILVLVITWAFRRLQRMHGLLAERTQDLLRANQELALVAKTSAVGAVASHLIHGLKSPLSGLQNFVTNISAGQTDRMAADWQQAVASARRMQTLITQAVSVLREEESGRHYELKLAEVGGIVADRVQALARERGVRFELRVAGEVSLPNRAANLLTLILVNLAQNGLEATPAGQNVTLALTHTGDRIVAEVTDHGPGFPETLRPSLFKPCQSTKEGGSGIGLAICKQLANHLGATLELKASSSDGCVFALGLPLALCERTAKATTLTVSG
jgi:signal transduction histidine kinase